ncbi:MAG: anti-sigma factor [Chloroflexota bacterium]
MTHAEARELIAPYALNSLEPNDLPRVEDHLAACVFCAHEASDAAEVVDYLAYATQFRPPPAQCMERLLSQVEREIPEIAQGFAGRDSARKAAPAREVRRPGRWIGWLSPLPIAASLLLALGLATWNVLLMGEVDSDHHQVATLNDRLVHQSQILFVMSSGDAVSRTLWGTSRAPNAEVRLVMDRASGKAMVMANRLPPPPPGQVYQVWLGKAGKRYPVARLVVDERGAGECTLPAGTASQSYDSAWITLEPVQGSPRPDSPGIARGTI